MPGRQEPLVSVVIPTIRRPRQVVRAVASALGQTIRDIEVIVVVDGPDEATVQALARIDDPRLRVVPLPENAGLGGARNAGVEEARSRWLALLDDDDEWLPRKLEVQLQTAENSPSRCPIVSCRFIARTEHGDVVWPRRRPAPGEPLSEYLFCQRQLLGGEGIVLPSTLLAPAALLREIRFLSRGSPYEGSEWLLRAARLPGVQVEFVATGEPLAIWNGEETRDRMSNASDWRASRAWAAAHADFLTPRARAGFLLIRTSLEAKRARDYKAFWLLLAEAFRRGRPALTSVLAHAIIWTLPRRVRFHVAAAMSRDKRSA